MIKDIFTKFLLYELKVSLKSILKWDTLLILSLFSSIFLLIIQRYFLSEIFLIASAMVIIIKNWKNEKVEKRRINLKNPKLWWNLLNTSVICTILFFILRRIKLVIILLLLSIIFYLIYRYFVGHWRGYDRKRYKEMY